MNKRGLKTIFTKSRLGCTSRVTFGNATPISNTKVKKFHCITLKLKSLFKGMKIIFWFYGESKFISLEIFSKKD